MLTVSPALAAAIESKDQSVSVRVWVDWDKDGFGGKGSLDDLSDRVAAVTVDRSLAGEFPEAARVVEGEAAATLTVDLAKGDTFDDRKSAAWWFSTVNPLSPLAGKRRKARPVVVDVGYKTNGPESDADGMEWVRVFTGTTRNIDVSSADGTAELTALDWRTKLSNDVTVPAVDGSVPGMTPSWLVSYALWQAGIAASARPEPGCRYWAPMHGSMTPLIGTSPSTQEDGFGVYHTPNPAAPLDPMDTVRPTFGPGPVTTPGLVLPPFDAGNQYWAAFGGDMADGPTMTVSGSAQGRIEMWVRRTWDGPDWAGYNIAPVGISFRTTTIQGIYNGDFETGTADGWIANGGTLTASQDYGYDSNWSGKLVPAGGATAQAIARSLSAPGASYTWSVYVYSPTGYSNVTADIDWLDDTGAYVSTTIGTATAIPAGQWVLLTTTGTAPGSAWNLSGKVSVRDNPTASDVVYIDGGEIANPDGTTLGAALEQLLKLEADGTITGIPGRLGGYGGIETHTEPVPNDGAWHFVGMHWDLDHARLKLVLDGDTETYENLWPTYGAQTAVDETDARVWAAIASDVADVRVTACDWDTPWANTKPPGAVIDASSIEIQATYDTDTVEAWSLIGDLASSEQAVVYWSPGTPESDPVFNYRTRRRLTSEAGQTVQQNVTAEASLIDLQIEDGTDQTANKVTVEYTGVQVQELTAVYTSTDAVLLHQNSTTTWDITFDKPVLALADANNAIHCLLDGPASAYQSYINIRQTNQGGGNYYRLPVSIVRWDSTGATLSAWNPYLNPVYVVPDDGGTGQKANALVLFGTNVVEATGQQAVQESQDSIDEYGVLPLPNQSAGPYLQDPASALGVAAALLGDLKDAPPIITDMPVLGDPRRELGDRVTVTDRDGTGLDGDYWLSAISEKIAPGSYTQDLSARKASVVSTWGNYKWGEDVVWT